MKPTFVFGAALSLFIAFNAIGQQTFYNVTAGNGNGLRFWSDDAYKIHMGVGPEYTYGPVTSYSIKMNMNNEVGRGWTWGNSGVAPVAALNNLGDMQIAGTFLSNKFGIGTTNPRGSFDVDGPGDIYLADDLNTGTGQTIYLPGHIYLSPYNGSDITYLQARRYNNSGTTSIQFRTYNNGSLSEAMKISGNGNVGIGTTSPAEALQIGIPGNTLSRKISIPGVYNFENLKVGQFGNGASGIELVNHLDLNNSYGFKLLANTDQATGFQIQYAPATSSYGALQYISGFYMGLNGYVGIGTNSPDAKLAVKGTLHAQEVKVDLSVPGPDYVFEENYSLPSLTETENFIKQNKHLPEVPSANEMEANGINVSEMNMLLLKKVEELTLHLIEMQKRMNAQEKRIEELTKK